LVSALLGVAALAGERALGHYGKPVRGVWVAAIAGSLLLPVAAYLVPAVVARLSPVSGGIPISAVDLGALLGGTADAPAGGGIDVDALLTTAGSALAWVWIVSVLGFGTFLVGTYRGLRREMRGWTPGRVLESPVMMSANRGPAVVGVGRGVIVMPAWIADLEEDLLRMIFLHEQEHQRSGDHRWFALGLGAVAVMPWNPFLWWQLRRLRLAIEYDCDHRVIARGVSRRDYAEALLAVGTRLSTQSFGAAAFAERRSAVERRLRRMTRPLGRLRGPRAVAAGGLGALALALACGSPLPMGFDSEQALLADAVQKVDMSARPAFIPYDRPPSLRNRADIVAILNRAYPADERARGETGRVELWL
jgi:hypothetical protein